MRLSPQEAIDCSFQQIRHHSMIMPVIFSSRADGGGVTVVQTYIVIDGGELQYNLFLTDMNSDGYGSSEYKVLLAKRYFYTCFMCNQF